MAQPLPPCPERFTTRKAAILEQLARPDDDYTDASPKGTVDEGVRPLIDVINKLDGFVTTSSCAGRVAVFLEGRKTKKVDDEEEAPQKTTIASAGGKGGGGKWLFVSHDPLVKGAADADADSPQRPPSYTSYSETDWTTVFGLDRGVGGDDEIYVEDADERLVHFKFEPMILHVLTASLAHAQLLLRCASMAGFRESGAVSIVPPPLSSTAADAVADECNNNNPALPIVAVRSMGLALAAVVGVSSDNKNDEADAPRCIVTPSYLSRLVRVADERFAVNRARTERFRVALVEAVAKMPGGGLSSEAAALAATAKKAGSNWEDAEARRLRKREEGLRRQAALKEQQQKQEEEEEEEEGTQLDVLLPDAGQ